MAREQFHKYDGAARVGTLGICLALGVLTTRAVEVAESQASATNALALKVDVRRNVEGSFLAYRYAFLTSGQDKFTFLVPETYRVDTSDPAKIKLASQDFSCLIVMGLGGGLPLGVKMEADVLRARVLTNYTDVTIRSEPTVCANGQSAPAVDFTWKTDSGLTRVTRTMFIPTTGGLMEFTLTASPETFDSGLRELNLIMLTFRSGVDGKFDYVTGSMNP